MCAEKDQSSKLFSSAVLLEKAKRTLCRCHPFPMTSSAGRAAPVVRRRCMSLNSSQPCKRVSGKTRCSVLIPTPVGVPCPCPAPQSLTRRNPPCHPFIYLIIWLSGSVEAPRRGQQARQSEGCWLLSQLSLAAC